MGVPKQAPRWQFSRRKVLAVITGAVVVMTFLEKIGQFVQWLVGLW